MKRFQLVFSKAVRQRMVVGLAFLVMLGTLGGAGILLSSTTSAYAASGCSYYTVRAGDTLSNIGAAHNSSAQAIAQANHIQNVNLIFVGQQLCIPTSAVSQPPQGPGQPGNSTVTDMINQVFGPYAQGAIQIANCESGLDPNAYNPISIGGSHAEGVFQILYPSTWMGTPEAASSPYNAMANIQAAYAIFVRDGYSWREWSCQA